MRYQHSAYAALVHGLAAGSHVLDAQKHNDCRSACLELQLVAA
jgi:hypothetical protein